MITYSVNGTLIKNNNLSKKSNNIIEKMTEEETALNMAGSLNVSGTIQAAKFMTADGKIIDIQSAHDKINEIKDSHVTQKDHKELKDLLLEADKEFVKKSDFDSIKTDVIDLKAGEPHFLKKSEDVELERNISVKNDIKFNGSNNWILHTPDDTRHNLYVAPSKEYGKSDWNWGSQTVFSANGDVQTSGNLSTKNIKMTGTDLNINNSGRKGKAAGSNRRALVHDNGDKLTINYAGDYTGGVKINGDVMLEKGKKLAFGDGDNDPYYLQKIGNTDSNYLKLTINDNKNESLQIWGNSCGEEGGCGGNGVMKHKFDSSGNATHKGSVVAKEFKLEDGTSLSSTPEESSAKNSHNTYSFGKGNEKLHIGKMGHGRWAGIGHASVTNNANNSKQNYALIQKNDGTTIVNAKSGKKLHFRQNNSDKMVIHTNGNVGIGTNKPKEKLDVNGTIRVHGSEGKFNAKGEGNQQSKKEYIQFVKTDNSSDGVRLYSEGPSNKGKLVMGIQDDLQREESFLIRGEHHQGQSAKDIAEFTADGNFFTNNVTFKKNGTNWWHRTGGDAAIVNADSHDTLMIVGRETGGTRKIGMWDTVDVNGNLNVTGKLTNPDLIPNNGRYKMDYYNSNSSGAQSSFIKSEYKTTPIDYNWGSGQVGSSGKNDNVFIRFSGIIRFPKTGIFRFRTSSDDGNRLFFNGMPITLRRDGNNNTTSWRLQGKTFYTSDEVRVIQNYPYPIHLEWYEHGGGANVQLYWNVNGGWQIIPISAFSCP